MRSEKPTRVTFTVSNIIANSAGTGGGAIGVAKLGTSTLTLSGVNTYTGGTTIVGGTLNVQNDQSAATGGWTISDTNLPYVSTVTVNFQSGSTVVVASGKSILLTTGFSFGNTENLNVAGTVTVDYLANVAQVGSTYQLSFTAIPEPGSAISLFGGLGILLGWNRRPRTRKS